MNYLRLVLSDRRRRQRGSVLSGVLIMVAFLSIIAGALMTELSTNFLLSRALVTRVANEATVNSAMERALDQLQNTPLASGCPTPNQASLNGRTGVVTYSSCFPVVDRRSRQFTAIATSSPFNIDGSHAQLSGLNDYIIGDAGGTIFDYTFGQSARRWKLPLGGSVTGPPLVMPDPSNGGQFLDLIPISGPSCNPSSFCVISLSDDLSANPPTKVCTMAAGAPVVTQSAAGRNFTNIVYSGDTAGTLQAYDPSNVGGGVCDAEATSTAAGDPIVGGPVVFPCRGGCKLDEIYALTSNGASSRLNHYTYANATMKLVASLPLPWADASGLVAEGIGLPTRVAISFGGGGVALVQLDSSANMNLSARTQLPTGIAAAPYWCHCPGSNKLIGVGGQNGALYLLDTLLNTYAAYPAGGAPISTSATADTAGDWFFGADDGFLYEVQQPAGQATMTLATRFGNLGGRVGSSAIVGGCPVGICVYLGAQTGSAYIVQLDARDAVMTACLSTAPPACSGDNPRLWAQVEVGAALSPRTVHVSGWSYYSP